MFRLFYKYLILYKKAAVPGIGFFYIERKAAKLDFANKIFIGPGVQVGFKRQALADDGSLYSFIASEQKVDVTEAAVRYTDFANKLSKNLSEKKTVELPGLGVLSEDADGQLFFTSTAALDNYFPPASAERVIRENAEHRIIAGDKTHTSTKMREILVETDKPLSGTNDNWWIFAIALASISIAMIVYYYLHGGSLH